MTKSSAWSDLANYESQDLVRQQYKKLHGGEANAGLAREIRSAVTQARAYFDAAGSADRTVKPLLLYYGVLGLSRALIMFLGRLREAALAQSHGLSPKNWGQIIEHKPFDLGQLQIEIGGRGTFSEFVSATNNKSLLTHNSSKVNLAYPHKLPAVGEALALDEFLSRIPELASYYARWKGRLNFCSADLAPDSSNTNVRVRKKQFGLEIDRSFIGDLFGQKNLVFQSDQGGVLGYKAGLTFDDLPEIWDHRRMAFGSVGDLVLVKDLPVRGHLSKPAAIFLLAYAFGMLVRYHPSIWMALIRNELGDAGLPTLLAAIDLIELHFPEIVLEFFEADGLNTVNRAT